MRTLFAWIKCIAGTFVLLAIFTGKTSWTRATVIHASICAMSTIFAWVVANTGPFVLFAVCALISGWASTDEIGSYAATLGSIFAWVRVAALVPCLRQVEWYEYGKQCQKKYIDALMIRPLVVILSTWYALEIQSIASRDSYTGNLY